MKRRIECWDDALKQMKKGDKGTVDCPAQLAYGAAGAGSAIPPNTDIIFDIEVLDWTQTSDL